MRSLPNLQYDRLQPTKAYLRDVALVLGSLQRAFIAPHPFDWQHGLEVNMRGLSGQSFLIADEETRATIDLVAQKVRIAGSKWPLAEYAAPEILNNIRLWLESRSVNTQLEIPKFSDSSTFNEQQARNYAEALWWVDMRFRDLAKKLRIGLVSPILLYPHHFDLSLTWFPQADNRQLAIGFSTGDETINEPYMYLTAYPEPKLFKSFKLPAEAHRQSEGFSGFILPYAKLRASDQPEKLFWDFAKVFTTGQELLSR